MFLQHVLLAGPYIPFRADCFQSCLTDKSYKETAQLVLPLNTSALLWTVWTKPLWHKWTKSLWPLWICAPVLWLALHPYTPCSSFGYRIYICCAQSGHCTSPQIEQNLQEKRPAVCVLGNKPWGEAHFTKAFSLHYGSYCSGCCIGIGVFQRGLHSGHLHCSNLGLAT